jgi:outer membrane protein
MELLDMIIPKNRQKFVILQSILLVTILSWTAEAKSTPADSQSDYARPKTLFFAGAGAIVTNKPYRGMDTKTRGMPFFLYKTERFSLYGPRMNYLLFAEEDWEISARTKLRFEGYDEDDSRFLQGMDDRKRTLEMGGSLSRNFHYGKITADVTADVLNEHKGYELGCYYSYDFRDSRKNPILILTPKIGLNYRSRQLNDYYYGVRASEATASRPEYNAGDSTGLAAGLRINYFYSDNISLMAMVSFEWLGNEIKKSPIVDKDHIESYIFGIMYKF